MQRTSLADNRSFLNSSPKSEIPNNKEGRNGIPVSITAGLSRRSECTLKLPCRQAFKARPSPT